MRNSRKRLDNPFVINLILAVFVVLIAPFYLTYHHIRKLVDSAYRKEWDDRIGA